MGKYNIFYIFLGKVFILFYTFLWESNFFGRPPCFRKGRAFRGFGFRLRTKKGSFEPFFVCLTAPLQSLTQRIISFLHY